MTRKKVFIYLLLIVILFLSVIGYFAASFLNESRALVSFDGEQAYADVQTQVDFGPRMPGSDGHAKVREWMRAELESAIGFDDALAVGF